MMQSGRGTMKEASGFVPQLRAPLSSPGQESLCFGDYSTDKEQVRGFGL